MDAWPNKMPWAPFNRADPANLLDDDDEDDLPGLAPHHWDKPFYYKVTETVGSITGSYYQSPMIFTATVAAPPNAKCKYETFSNDPRENQLLARMAAKYDHKKKACLDAITDSIAVGENPLESMLGSC